MQFLVVDDSPVDRHLLVSLLEDLGHQAVVCENPSGILEQVSSGQYASIFLDIVMPEQDGYKILRTLRSHPETSDQHVIVYSSKNTPLEINYGIKRAGADAYLSKPATRESVAEALFRVPA